jgi:hypothetical protein
VEKIKHAFSRPFKCLTCGKMITPGMDFYQEEDGAVFCVECAEESK